MLLLAIMFFLFLGSCEKEEQLLKQTPQIEKSDLSLSVIDKAKSWYNANGYSRDVFVKQHSSQTRKTEEEFIFSRIQAHCSRRYLTCALLAKQESSIIKTQ